MVGHLAESLAELSASIASLAEQMAGDYTEEWEPILMLKDYEHDMVGEESEDKVYI